MRRPDGSTRQTMAWVTAAMAAPLAHFCGCGWWVALLTAAVCLPLAWWGCKGWKRLGKAAAALEFLWLAVVLGSILSASGLDWPGERAEQVVPLTLLALAAWPREEAGFPMGAVLAGLLGVLAAPVAVSAVSRLHWAYLKPTWAAVPWGLAAALLLPSVAGVLGNGLGSGRLGLGALAVALAGSAQGILSAPVAQGEAAVFWEVSRALGRWEPLLAVALTLSWYGFASFLLTAAGKLAGQWNLSPGKGRWTAALLAAGWMLWRVEAPSGVLLIGTVIAWSVLPGVAGSLGCAGRR